MLAAAKPPANHIGDIEYVAQHDDDAHDNSSAQAPFLILRDIPSVQRPLPAPARFGQLRQHLRVRSRLPEEIGIGNLILQRLQFGLESPACGSCSSSRCRL